MGRLIPWPADSDTDLMRFDGIKCVPIWPVFILGGSTSVRAHAATCLTRCLQPSCSLQWYKVHTASRISLSKQL